MPVPRSHLSLFLAICALAVAAPGCSTDDAAERDAKNAGDQIDKEAGKADEEAGKEIKKGAEDVDGN